MGAVPRLKAPLPARAIGATVTIEANDPWDPQPAIAAMQEAFDGAAANLSPPRSTVAPG